MPDEAGTAGMARFLTGGEFNMFATNTYRPALSVFLMPIFALVDDPETLVTVSLAVNALIGGLTVFWLVPVIRRLTGFSGRGLLSVSGLLLLSPSSLESSAHLWAEPLVSMCFLAALWAVLRFNDEPTWRIGIVALAVVGTRLHLPWQTASTRRAHRGRSRRSRPVRPPLHIGRRDGGVRHRARPCCRVGSRSWIVEHVWQFPGDQNDRHGRGEVA